MEGFLVRSSYASADEAWAAGRRIVQGGLGACAHVQQVRSCYTWKGALEEEDEWLLEVRTTPRLRDAVVEALTARHPYDVPMVEALHVHVSDTYGAWMDDVTAGSGGVQGAAPRADVQ